MESKKFTFHLLGLVHLPTARKYSSCAFTQKNVKLAKMLFDLGHTVYLYGCRSTEEAPLEEYIFGTKNYKKHTEFQRFNFTETHTAADIAKFWGNADNRFEVGYDWTNTDFRHDFNTEKKSLTNCFNSFCREVIKSRAYRYGLTVRSEDLGHFLLCTQGSYHSDIADKVKLFLTCEPGIGYRGSVEGRYRAFESSYIMDFTYGSEHPRECINGSYYDRVIPNYFDLADITYSDKKEDYYLFIGRMIKRKGILTAALACEAIGKKLIIAGQGAHIDHRGYLVPNTDPDFELAPGNWEYVGYVDVEHRKKLMAHAIATFTPTEYLECFAGTHIESMLSGTPPITTNFGVFPGTIPDTLDGHVGYRCNTLQNFVDAANDARKQNYADRAVIRDYARKHYEMDNVALKFEAWFQDLYKVFESTQQAGVKGWSRID